MLGFLFETGKPLSVTLETSVDGWMDKQATQSGFPEETDRAGVDCRPRRLRYLISSSCWKFKGREGTQREAEV